MQPEPEVKMSPDFRQQLLIKELETVQSEIDRYDNNSLTIKGWGVTIATALVAYGVEKNKPIIVLAATFTTVGFGLVEFWYRRFQLRFMRRSREIEDCLRVNPIVHSYSVSRTATNSLGLRTETLTVLLKTPQFSFFYAIVLIFAIGSAVYVFQDGRPEKDAPKLDVTVKITNSSPISVIMTNPPQAKP